MRSILVPTDYSKPAKNAAYYALHLANALKANIELCHAFNLPFENPMLGQTAWALYEYPALQEENSEELKKLVKKLEKKKKLCGEMKLFLFIPRYLIHAKQGMSLMSLTVPQKKTAL
ncbi:universal stress protein [Chryseobacterium wanjuense]